MTQCSSLAKWDVWTTDPCMNVFLEAQRRWHLPFVDGGRILEIGCAEYDWLTVAGLVMPHAALVGIDVRESGDSTPQITRIRGDVLVHDFPANSFDWVVLISALEHIGLGHYGDPLDPEGDTRALTRAYQWLVPGGFLYFDVPFHPTTYSVQSECRIYDSAAVSKRLWASAHWYNIRQEYTHQGAWSNEPMSLDASARFELVVCWWMKPPYAE